LSSSISLVQASVQAGEIFPKLWPFFGGELNDQEFTDSPKDLLGTVLGVAAPRASYRLASRLIAEGADSHAQRQWYELEAETILKGLKIVRELIQQDLEAIIISSQ
jgi:hypothetical protein